MQNQKRLTGNTPLLMIFIAVAIDLFQILLDFVVIGVVVNRLVDIVALVLFYVWFKSKKVSFTKMRALIFFGLGFLEFFPAVDAFPLWIIDVLAVIISVNTEDRLGLSAETIISNPRMNRILKKGIIKGVNVVGKRNNVIRGALNKSGWPQNTDNIDGSRQNSGNQRNIDNTPIPNSTRDAKIKEQQMRKSNAQNKPQN